MRSSRFDHSPFLAAARFSMLLSLLTPAMALARDPSAPGRFWVGFDPGVASLHRSSGEEPSSRQGSFTMAFRLGYAPTPSFRVGLELGGWLIQVGNLNDPSKGAAVAQYNLLVQTYPLSAKRLYLRTGGGRAVYWDNRPLQFGSSGWGFTVGAGYDVPLGKRYSLGPEINYSGGRLGDVRNVIRTSTDRRYHALGICVGVTYR